MSSHCLGNVNQGHRRCRCPELLDRFFAGFGEAVIAFVGTVGDFGDGEDRRHDLDLTSSAFIEETLDRVGSAVLVADVGEKHVGVEVRAWAVNWHRGCV